jgi:Arc/MetJ-type ribon-helix-helix transcriptional regulator
MEQNIGRPALILWLQLQIHLVEKYEELLKSGQFENAREKVNAALKAAIEAVGPILSFGHEAARKVVDTHKDGAVPATLFLLKKLLEQEQARDKHFQSMRERAARVGQQKS